MLPLHRRFGKPEKRRPVHRYVHTDVILKCANSTTASLRIDMSSPTSRANACPMTGVAKLLRKATGKVDCLVAFAPATTAK
jgi:hypothetical protein